jgi:DivIVA domain-containing protein
MYAKETRGRAGTSDGGRSMSPRSTESLAVYVRQRAFKRVMRGYDPAEVDRNLETVSQMISTGALQELVREQEERLAQREAAAEAAEAHARQLVEQAERELNAARTEADATLAGAQAKARADEAAAAKLLDEARLQAEASEIITAARAEAERILDDARTQGLESVQREVAAKRAEADKELDEYEARRRREADRIVEAARDDRGG